jgi:Acyl-CoA carboxylase epsilon subunit
VTDAGQDAAAVAPAVALRVVRGQPTAEELAAVVALLAARARSRPRGEGRPPASRWADPRRLVRGTGSRGVGWRSSGLPL